MYMMSSGLVGRGLRLEILEVSPESVAGISELVASTAASEVPATDPGETSGIYTLRPRPTSPEDTIYILSVN